MPALGKVFDSILNSTLTFSNLSLEIDDKLPFGFKQNSRTTDKVLTLNSLIRREKSKKIPLSVVLLTLPKLLTI